MRIAIISHKFAKDGGQARVNYELARHCLCEGIEVDLISERATPDLIEQGARWHKIVPLRAKPQMLSNWSFAGQADRLIQALRPEVDLFVGNGFVARHPHDISVCHMLHTAFLKSPYFPWRPWARTGPNGWYQALYTRANSRWERQSYAAASMIVAVSEKVQRELLDIGLPPRKVRVIHNGVDLDEFCPGSVDRAKLGLPAGCLAFFAGGIRNALRNLDSILKALVLVPGVHLAVAGDLKSSPYPAMAAKLGLRDRVSFLGYRRDIPELMRSADFFVYPSRYEACSLVLLEAMSSGLPIITAVTAGGSELLTSECGWVLDNPHDINALAQRMRRLSEDTALRARMSEAARATASQYSWSRMAAQYLELFREYADGVTNADADADADADAVPSPAIAESV
jgi:glycosyltransferase involved in cell wall biosynthesis